EGGTLEKTYFSHYFSEINCTFGLHINFRYDSDVRVEESSKDLATDELGNEDKKILSKRMDDLHGSFVSRVLNSKNLFQTYLYSTYQEMKTEKIQDTPH
ncbi:hypothetical protein L9F63_016991, partial [Diploptera punctata]